MALRSLTARWAAASSAVVRTSLPALSCVPVQAMHTSSASLSSVSVASISCPMPRMYCSPQSVQPDPVLAMARTPQTGLSLKQLVDFGSSVKAGGSVREETLIMAARFLHHELPIRFAHRIAELRHLPHGLAEMSSVQRVASWLVQNAFSCSACFSIISTFNCRYERSMKDLSAFPVPSTPAQEKEFTKLITDIFERYTNSAIWPDWSAFLFCAGMVQHL